MAIINGDNLANVLVGTDVADTINGLARNYVLVGLAGNDVSERSQNRAARCQGTLISCRVAADDWLTSRKWMGS